MMIKDWKTFGRIISYSYGTDAAKVERASRISKYKWLILMIIQLKIKQSII